MKSLSDKARQWMAENAKAFECWNAYVEKNGLPLARFNDLGQESGETILQLTDEQIPRFVEAAKEGKGLPHQIVSDLADRYQRNPLFTKKVDQALKVLWQSKFEHWAALNENSTMK